MNENTNLIVQPQQNGLTEYIPTGGLYAGLASNTFSEDQQKQLSMLATDEEIALRPDGLIYVPEILYRRKLNAVFGAGNWGIHPRGTEKHGNTLCYKGALFIAGRFVAETIGEQDYIEDNPIMSWATAHEGAKTNCLVRCCKDIGLFSNLWEPKFIKYWLDKYGTSVWCENQKDKKKKKLWRKKTDSVIDQWPWKECDSRTDTF